MSRPPGTPDLDLTTVGTSGSILGDNAVFQTIDLQPAGSGVFNPFVQLQHSPTEQGYNTDAPPQFNEKRNITYNHSLLLASVPIVTGDGSNGTTEGVAYRMFTLDLNDPNNAPYVSLDSLQIYQEEAGNLTGFNPNPGPTGGFTGSHTNYLAYNLDAGGDHWVALNEQSHGSGQADVVVLIPDAAFINDAAHRYVTVYSLFGAQSGWSSDGGFEEWATNGGPNSGPLSAMAVHKTVAGGHFRPGSPPETLISDTNKNGVWDPAETLTSDANENGVWDLGDTFVDANHNGVWDPADTFIDANSNGVWDPAVPDTPIADAVGEVITYKITVDNVGNTALTNVVATDVINGGAPVPLGLPGVAGGDLVNPGVLDVGETWTYTLTYTVTQADLDSNGRGTGFITNTVTVDTAQTTPVSSTASVVVEQPPPSLAITKTPDVTSVFAPGDIHYTITVQNVGAATLTGLAVTDPQVTNQTPIYDVPVLSPTLGVNVPVLSATLGVNVPVLAGL